MNHVSDANAAEEIKTAILFDLRDNPYAREHLDHLVKSKGKAGEKEFNDIILKEIDKEYKGDRSDTMFPWTRAAIRTLITGGVVHHEWGLGQIGSIIGGVLSAGIQAATSVYTTKLTLNTQEDIAKMQLRQNQQQIDQANAVQQAQQAQAVQAMQQNVSGGGTPSWGSSFDNFPVVPVAIGGVALIAAIFILPKVLGGKKK